MKIFVGNIPSHVMLEEARMLFEAYGAVDDVTFIVDEDGRFRGFGFVQMPNDDDARAAISDLNGSDWWGTSLTVSEAL
ncbi:RNA recognition motif domain-containing protein [Candidatus Entotheonella palauensis]|uniref:RNA recognition motif domain-containing protein n=1 Tax=Candidatus Entotheonella palauensis TaxID=93172 RepID=UPI000B7D0ED7|nr:hypothetical protein [Candidatus Entotheonella palauensis]